MLSVFINILMLVAAIVLIKRALGAIELSDADKQALPFAFFGRFIAAIYQDKRG